MPDPAPRGTAPGKVAGNAGMGIVDSHQHLWDPRALDYPEFAADDTLNRPFLAADYDAAAGQCGVLASVSVEAASAGAPGFDETTWLLRESARSSLIAGVITWAPVEDPGIERHLARLLSLATPPVVGIRRGFEFDDPSLLVAPRVVAGIRAIGDAGLPFDLLINAGQLQAAADLVRRCPDTRFVLDHVGSPPPGVRGAEQWHDDLARLAECERVTCKLSGLPALPAAGGWQLPDLAERIQFALSVFGSERTLFGSDWPVSTGGGGRGLAAWLAVVTSVLDGHAMKDQIAVLGGNACRIYGLRVTSGMRAGPSACTAGERNPREDTHANR